EAEQVPERLLLDPQPRRCRDPQFLDPLRPAYRKLRRDPAAQAHPAKDHLLQTEGVEEFEIVKGHVLDGVYAVETAALAETGVRRHVDGELLRPRLVEGQPHRRLAEGAVQVDEGRTAAAMHDDGRSAAHVNRLRLAALARQEDPGPV